MSLLVASSRTILMISDEELFIYSLDSKGVNLVESVPWSADDFEESVSRIISKNCGGKPVLILNDMVEQHYKKEKVPKVSALDKANVVKRKLKVAFPSYPVRAALPLKEKVSKSDLAIAGSVYLFAAVPATESFTKTIAAAKRSLAPIIGFFLLPIESTDMIKKLADKLPSKDKTKAQWTIFMGQHKNGGLRQIVIRNGELALTRMTPIAENDGDSKVWANEVNQEIQATMSYLSRFGYQPSDGLNIILVSDQLSGEMVDDLVDIPCNFHSLSANDIARKLKLNIGRGEDGCFADALHMAWIGKKQKFILPMRSRQLDTVSKPRKVASMLTVLLVLGSVVQGFQYMSYLQSVSEASSEVDAMKSEKVDLDSRYEVEVKRMEELGYDIQLMQSSLALHSEFENGRVGIINLFRNIGRGLGRDMRIDKISVDRSKPSIMNKFSNKKDPTLASSFIVSMQIIFPSDTNAEQGNREINALSDRIQKTLPDNMVSVTKLLEDYEYSEAIVVETGDTQQKDTNQDYVAEISISIRGTSK